MKQIILASTSPRRKKLLEDLGIPFTVDASSYLETMDHSKSPQVLAKILSLGKAEKVAKKHKNAIVIGADTIVWCKGKMLGKPRNKKEAQDMLFFLSGNMHKVITGITVIDTSSRKSITKTSTSRVWMKKLSKEEIVAYVVSGEPMDKAGAYAIQGKGGLFIEKIHGDMWGIIGLPIFQLDYMLKEFDTYLLYGK